MASKEQTNYERRCMSKEAIIKDGGLVVENDNGTISVFVQTANGLTYQPLTKSCCEALGAVKSEAGLELTYTFDIETQECRWSAGCTNNTKPFKVVMNPLGNDGVIFNTNQTNNEHCTLRISFDYLFQIDCDDIMARIREANTTQGLDPRTLELVSSLQAQQDKCQKTLESLQTQLLVLYNQLEETPFVIQCTNSVVVNVKDPIKYQTTKTPRGNLDVGFGTTRMMVLSSYGTTTYCLTDLGLQSWSNILGNNNYTTWLNSNGTNTSVYTCEDVNNLVTQDNNTGDLLGTCDVSLTARDEIWKEIVITQQQILETEKRCEGITSQLNELLPDVACSTVSEILETLNVAMTLDMVNPSTGDLETVYEQSLLNIGLGNLPTYLTSTTPNTGFYSTGTTGNTNCENVGANLYQELLPLFPNSGTTDIQNLIINSFNSTWLQYETEITDQTLLDMIYNEKIKLSFLVKDCCVNFGILVDRIKLTKICENVDNVSFDITKNPSFDMIRVIDNKKSWLANEDFEHREFDLKFRDTQYDINNYKLAINTKEVDLDINPANAIEQDVFCYIRDNECLLECPSTGGLVYRCPSGTVFNETKSECVNITYTSSTFSGTALTATTGDTLSGVYDRYGVVFLGDVTNEPWPLSFSSTTGVSGSYSGTSFAINGSGETINAVAGGPGTGSTYYGPASIQNTLWGSFGGGGRMNNAGVKISGGTFNQWVGFSHCIDVPYDGVYQVGLGADDRFRFKLNGEMVFDQQNIFTSLNPYPPYSLYINHFWVFGLDLKAGKNIIEMEYINTVFGSSENLTAEIYAADIATLSGMTSEAQLSAVTIFSTKDLRNTEFQLGETDGYSCPTGYSLDTCVPPPYQCAKIEKEAPIAISGECCCQGEVTTITQDTAKICTCLYEKIFYETLDGRYEPLSAYSLTTNWIIDVTYNCGELLYETEFFTGNGSTTEELIPTPESYASALTGMAETLGLDYTYSGGVVTITEVNDCENSYLNNNFKIDLRLTICACYIPYVHDCVTTSGICESLSGDTIVEFILPSVDFMDDALYKPACELFEQYSCGEDAEDWEGQFRVDRDAFLKAQNQYNICVTSQHLPESYCAAANPDAFDYDFYYDALAQSATGYTGYAAFNVVGPMRKVKFNWWMPVTYYSAWTETMGACSTDPTYSANSLADIFTGITDVNYLPSVADWADISGVTGNIGDIVMVTGTTTEYFWHPIDNIWVEVSVTYDCISASLSNLLTIRRSDRDAYVKAKNQLILTIKPFLWSSVYIPEFQINKYIL